MKITLIFAINIICCWNLLSQCPCETMPIDTAQVKFKNIVMAELISKSQNTRRFHKNQSFLKKGIVNKFKIHHIYKGEFLKGDTIQSLTGNGIEDNGYIFEIGKFYILFHEKYVDKCSPTQVYNGALNYILSGAEDPNMPPPPPPPPPGYTSKLWKYESDGLYYWSGLKAEIINDNKDEILKEFKNKISNINEIYPNPKIFITLNDQNQVISSRLMSHKCKTIEIPDELKRYIEQNIRFKTKNENCLINNSRWSFYYREP